MKPFVTSFLGSLLALVVGGILFVLLMFGIFGAIAGSFEKEKASVEANSVLKLNLNYAIDEQTQSGAAAGLALLGLDVNQGVGLNDILSSIEHAATDKSIKGIYVQLGVSPNSYGTLQEIRQALADFKAKSGKFVVAYGEVITQNAYYVGSVADKIYMHPAGALDFKGLSAQVSFYKGALDKLGVQTQIFYDVKFKSATEPFRLDRMSDENRLQLETFLNGMFDEHLMEIAASRKIDVTECRRIADSLAAWYPSEAVRLQLIDGLKYYDEVETELKTRSGIAEDSEMPMITLSDYRSTFYQKASAENEGKIAVVYATGTIIDGSSRNGFLGSTDFSEMMRKVRSDADIKAVVLRVNSPGGSAVASDVMWREIELTKQQKPVVVSMGDYAASGGYMISCNATKIFAQPNTLTGSIGVFLIIPEFSGLMENKLGITIDTANTSTYADFPSVYRPFSTHEQKILQSGVDSTYKHFKQMVASGRGLTMEQVESIAQGRIWTGSEARENGLVDEIGGIDEAVAAAAELGKIKNYFVVEYPEQKSSILDEVVLSLTEEAKMQLDVDDILTLYPHYMYMRELLERPVIQARLPYEIEVK